MIYGFLVSRLEMLEGYAGHRKPLSETDQT